MTRDTTRGVLLRLQDDVLVLGPATVVLTNNGEILDGDLKVPATGPIGVEGIAGRWSTAAFASSG